MHGVAGGVARRRGFAQDAGGRGRRRRRWTLAGVAGRRRKSRERAGRVGSTGGSGRGERRWSGGRHAGGSGERAALQEGASGAVGGSGWRAGCSGGGGFGDEVMLVAAREKEEVEAREQLRQAGASGAAARCARREWAPALRRAARGGSGRPGRRGCALRVGAGVAASRRVEGWRWAAVSRRPGVGDGERGWRLGVGVAAGWRWAATSRRGRDGGGRRRRGQDGEGCGGVGW
jgi:hypothetical protein